MSGPVDLKGNPIEIDSLVEGFSGTLRNVRKGRVYAISPYGWVAAWSEDPDVLGGHQHIFYPGRFLVRDKPRPPAKRTDIPERLKR